MISVVLCLIVVSLLKSAAYVKSFSCLSHHLRANVLSRPGAKHVISQVEDDGYSLTYKHKGLARKLWNSISGVQPGTLILVRHGETALNYNNTFTGWIDTDLSERGRLEVEHSARLLLERGYSVDVVYTSRLKRAIRSAWILLIGLSQVYKPVYKSWRLNERMYGDLEGKSKQQIAHEWGEEVVQQFRAGLFGRPPPMSPNHPHWHKKERKYYDLDPSEIPETESLQDTMERTIPLWESRILPDLESGKNVMIVAHANSLRGVVKLIENFSPEEISKVGIPNGIPLVYKFDRKMKSIPHEKAIAPLRGEFLEKRGLLKAALDREFDLASRVPGYDMAATWSTSDIEPSFKLPPLLSSNNSNGLLSDFFTSKTTDPTNDSTGAAVIVHGDGIADLNGDGSGMTNTLLASSSLQTSATLTRPNLKTQFDPILNGLTKLYKDRQLINNLVTADKKDGSVTQSKSSTGNLTKAVNNNYDSGDEMGSAVSSELHNASYVVAPHGSMQFDHLVDTTEITSSNPVASSIAIGNKNDQAKLMVIIRHGKTEYNKLGIFTGWEDAPLSEDGREEARAAGRLLKLHNIEFDIVYTSWLSRAIETAWLILNEMDSLWLPISKTWRLNERMYGALTGMSKKMIAEKHGVVQFKKWRRSFATRPPPTSSFSSVYPGNDERYVKNSLDVRYSVFESLIRSISHGRFELHRKFPKTESLQDCMSRTIPFFKDVIVPTSINKGKTVLISSSENAIRGLLMHLCDISPDRISEVEVCCNPLTQVDLLTMLYQIPTGLPLVYNLEKKCIQILDDGIPRENPMELLDKYDFGTSPELLFKPCNYDDNDEEQDSCYFYEVKGKSYAYDPIIRLPIESNGITFIESNERKSNITTSSFSP